MEAIDPEPTAPVGEAILEALRDEPAPRGGWDAAALREGVDADEDA